MESEFPEMILHRDQAPCFGKKKARIGGIQTGT